MSTKSPQRPAATPIREMLARRPRNTRHVFDKVFAALCIAAACVSVAALAILLVEIFRTGLPHLNWNFITSPTSADPGQAGIGIAAIGTICIVLVCGLTAIPIGICAAILLEEYRPRHYLLQRAHDFVQLNITNLAGVPSVVYGLLGLTVFVYLFNLGVNWEAGATYYDRFITAGGKTLLVARADANAAGRSPRDVTQFLDANLRPASIEVVGAAEFEPQKKKVGDDVAAVVAAVNRELTQQGLTDTDQIAARLGEALQRAGLTTPVPTAELQASARGLVEARGLSGRAARKRIEAAGEGLWRFKLAQEFGNVLLDDQQPQLEVRKAPWYLRLPFGRSVLTGGLTLMLVVLPIIIISTQEALRAVPRSLRHASLAMGATQWQTIWKVTLPAGLPGIMTGIILAMSRASGEAAPVLMVAAGVFITFAPTNLMDGFTAMPLQIFNWVGRPQDEFRDIAAAGIILLLLVLLCFNGLAIFIRQRAQRMS